jgi:hypothetical protein
MVTDHVLVANRVAGKVTSQLDGSSFADEIYAAVMPNPTIEGVQAGVAAFASQQPTAGSPSAAVRRRTPVRRSGSSPRALSSPTFAPLRGPPTPRARPC